MGNISVNIDGIDISINEGATILEAAREAKINIPTLCYYPDQKIKGNCRVCIVEVEGQRAFSSACSTPVKNGMKVRTNTKKVRDARKLIVEMMLAEHNVNCPECEKDGSCELQNLCRELNIRDTRLEKFIPPPVENESNAPVIRDESKCIKCGRCVETCNEVQGVGAIYTVGRSCDMQITPAYGRSLDMVKCVYCGQCINVCPVGAIYERDDTDRVWEALEDKDRHVVVQMAPAVRVAFGEEFGMEPGSIVTGKIVSFLRRIGFAKVFDTNFTADLTIMEEGNELLYRLKNNGRLPMFTSCSPGWIRFVEFFYPEFMENLSTCKSPQQMFGALAKTYYAQKFSIDPAKIVVVSIMPCTAKKAEAERGEMNSSGYPDIDIVITTRELARMARQSGIDIKNLDEEDFDEPFGISTGAGAIFGSSGGVMEAALRTVYYAVCGKEMEDMDIREVRGIKGFKESTIKMGDMDIKVAVVNGLGNARMILDMIKEGKADYHFIEFMCCPGGCIGGGGQPIPNYDEIKAKRAEAIYKVDRNSAIRRSHLNPVVNTLYSEFLGQPLGEMSHKLLHTHYKDRSSF